MTMRRCEAASSIFVSVYCGVVLIMLKPVCQHSVADTTLLLSCAGSCLRLADFLVKFNPIYLCVWPAVVCYGTIQTNACLLADFLKLNFPAAFSASLLAWGLIEFPGVSLGCLMHYKAFICVSATTQVTVSANLRSAKLRSARIALRQRACRRI